ncbi:MAG: TolC family protein [Bacteroidales bacterium]|jgi:outer membrane protein TolC|nr:TolC family protein [Bacteroidales bacterium]
MMLNKKTLIALCGAILIEINVMGQDSLLRLSVKDAENYALEHNRLMKTASLDIKKAEATKWYAISTMLPQVTTALDYTDYLGYEVMLGAAGFKMNPTTNFTAQAAIAVSGQQIVSATLGKIAIDMAKTNYEKTERNIKSQLRTIYFSILAMENTVDLLDRNMDNMLKLEAFAQQSATVGVSEQTDADQISVQVSSMRNTINSTKRSLEMLYNSMRLMLGTKVDMKIVLTEDIGKVFDTETIEKLLDQGFSPANNLDYQLTEKNVELAKKQVRINEWAYGPSLRLYYQYTGKIKKSDFDMNPPQVIGLNLSIPIFSSGNKLAKVNEAKCDYKSAMYNLETIEDQLKIQDRQLRYNLRTNLENYETQRKNIDVSQRVFTNISNKYEHGYASSIDLTNASTNLIAAQSNYIQAMLELLNAQIELETLLNK